MSSLQTLGVFRCAGRRQLAWTTLSPYYATRRSRLTMFMPAVTSTDV